MKAREGEEGGRAKEGTTVSCLGSWALLEVTPTVSALPPRYFCFALLNISYA